jgi:FHA domain
MSLFSEIEKTIERGFRKWTERMFGPAEADDLISLHRAILEEVETHVETVARGRRVFPYARLTVTLVASDPGRRAVLESAFGERLGADVAEALTAAGCELPKAFAVQVRTAEAGERRFSIEYFTQPPEPPAAEPVSDAPVPAASIEPARLIVAKGKTGQPEYTLEKARTNLGRLAELMDADQRMTRRNDVVFEEGGDDANGTVSRRHAHIKREGPEYRICDDGSEFGTRVFRDGRSIDVPAGNRRGEKLRPGDEIYLGRACLRFER